MTRRATVCYVDTVTHREMRNNSGEILRRVAAGESIQVTNNGRVAALIVPPGSDALTEVALRHQVRPAIKQVRTLSDIPRRAARRPSQKIVSDARGHW